MEGYKEIIITREKSPWGCAVDFTVLLDDKVVGILRNGTTVSAYAQDGPHTLSFQKGRKIDCSISILVSPDDTAKVVNTAISGSHLVVESEYTTNTPETAAFDSKNDPEKRGRRIKGNVAFAAVIVVAIIAAASLTFGGRSGRPSNAGSDIPPQSTDTQTSPVDKNSVGLDGVVSADCFDISIVDVKWTTALETSLGTIEPDDASNGLLCIIFSAKNTTDSVQNVASIGFNAYADGKKVIPKVVVGSIDDAVVFVGAVSPGMEIVGHVVWELPSDWEEFQTSYIDSGTARDSKQHFTISRDFFEQVGHSAVQNDADISNLIFGPGTYTVGTDIPAGTYDCVAVSGFGVLRGDVASLGNVGFVQTMGTATSEIGNYSANVSASNSYSNLKVENGDVLYIEMTLNVKFVPA